MRNMIFMFSSENRGRQIQASRVGILQLLDVSLIQPTGIKRMDE